MALFATVHPALHARAPRLLVALLLLILSYPLLSGYPIGRVVDFVLYTLVLLTATVAAGRRSHAFYLTAGLALVAGALLWTSLALGDQTLRLCALLAFSLFGFLVTATLLSQIVQARVVDLNVLCAALSTYLLIGVSWATSYALLAAVQPSSFKSPEPMASAAAGDFVYFSLVTLTTLGYGDVTPVTAFARIWSALEAVVGVIFMATLVARLVSVYQRRRPTTDSEPGGDD